MLDILKQNIIELVNECSDLETLYLIMNLLGSD